MATVIGVITDIVRAGYSRQMADSADPAAFPIGDLKASGSWVIGEGGWQYVVPPTKVRRVPDPTFTNVDAILDAARPPASQRYAADERFVFMKNFAAGDVLWVAPSVVQLTCLLDFGDANDDGFGNPPEFWEIGIFDQPGGGGNMVAYFTMDKQTKTPAVQLLNVINLIW
jgi:hypothetical protein